jgi:hypothetical protein
MLERRLYPMGAGNIISVPGLPRGLFIEVKLLDDDPEEPCVQIVSAHRQLS